MEMGLMWLLNSPLNTDKHFTNVGHNWSPAGRFLITQHTYEHTLCSSPSHTNTHLKQKHNSTNQHKWKSKSTRKHHKLVTPSEHSTVVKVHSRSKRFHRNDVRKTVAKCWYTLHDETSTQLSHLEILQPRNSIPIAQKFPRSVSW